MRLWRLLTKYVGCGWPNRTKYSEKTSIVGSGTVPRKGAVCVKLHRGRGNVVILGLKVVLRRMKRQTLRSNSGFLSEIGNATFTHSLDLGLVPYQRAKVPMDESLKGYPMVLSVE